MSNYENNNYNKKTMNTRNMTDTQPARILIVEDSPRLLPLLVEQAGLTFAEQPIRMTNERNDHVYERPGLVLHHCDTLDAARDLLGKKHFDGVVLDIGFPTSDITERLTGNRNGLKLLGELRHGGFGEPHRSMPVALTSVEHVHSKLSHFMRENPDRLSPDVLGATRAFFKGGPAPGTEGMNVFNSTVPSFERTVFTRENVAQQPVEWLKKEIDRARHPPAAGSHAGRVQQQRRHWWGGRQA